MIPAVEPQVTADASIRRIIEPGCLLQPLHEALQ
jgi:hypothetical protein